eukprot:TRINITY_DN13080_c0_g1_i1.p1 TRINITY_DN13080_c0_g1~~TRINITY_DN13080_c0_g1_i1.p1  ORF type:complete len:145 (-),score=21.11 TRINITY_DN13080_c0_g1_i1:178-612(-)
MIKRFIDICWHLFTLNNFHSLMSIFAALNMTPIRRLRGEWKEIPERSLKKLNTVGNLMSMAENSKTYRSHLKKVCDSPHIPLVVIFLQDLAQIEEIPTMTENGLINVHKMRLHSSILQELERPQRSPFTFTEDSASWNLSKHPI